MTLQYAVGIKVRNKTGQTTVEAEDALIAALKVKAAHPEAAITYVRKRNVRGDRRHPHSSQIGKNPAGPPPDIRRRQGPLIEDSDQWPGGSSRRQCWRDWSGRCRQAGRSSGSWFARPRLLTLTP
jgi:hypothetical protein